MLFDIFNDFSKELDREAVVNTTDPRFQGSMRKFLESQEGEKKCVEFFNAARMEAHGIEQKLKRGELAVVVHDKIRDNCRDNLDNDPFAGAPKKEL